MIRQPVVTCSVGKSPSRDSAWSIPPRPSDRSDVANVPVKGASAQSIRLPMFSDAYLPHFDATDDYPGKPWR